ncbi:HMCN [Mytilus edulis]|uniref:HMCN n=1 Tax=Mytilus edulis TaxID=6550 RepID=A0A8S3VBR5_MYTED|nr:HMCN [Mytilus edulis]
MFLGRNFDASHFLERKILVRNLHNNPLECCKIIDFFKWAALQTKLTDFQGTCKYLNTTRFLNKFHISICPIPVDGQWGSWTTTSCSVTCGNGIKHRNRTCNNPSPSDGGKLCQGVDNESLVCKLGDCSVDGHWGPWSSVTCSVTCGKGLGIRKRRCDNPPSSGDGNGCFGCDIEKKLCSLEKCHNGEWKKARRSKMISNHRFMKNMAPDDIDFRGIEVALDDIDFRGIEVALDDIDFRGIEVALDDIDFRGIEVALDDIDFRGIEVALDDIDFRVNMTWHLMTLIYA